MIYLEKPCLLIHLTFTVNRDGRELVLDGPEDIMTQLGRAGDSGLGVSLMPSVISQVSGEAAMSIGLQPWDKIKGINGTSIDFWDEMNGLIQKSKGDPILVEWERELERADTSLALPESVKISDVSNGLVTYEAVVAPTYNEPGDNYILGVYGATEEMMSQLLGIRKENLSLDRAVVLGFERNVDKHGSYSDEPGPHLFW